MQFATMPAEGQPTLRIPLDRIIDNPYQYRRTYSDEDLAELAANISAMAGQLPATLQPIPPGKGFTGYNRPSWGDREEVIKHPPPPFPLEWMPEPADERVIGPCGGCRFLVAFAGDGGPRCAQNSAAVCYNRKTDLSAHHSTIANRNVRASFIPVAVVISQRTGNTSPTAHAVLSSTTKTLSAVCVTADATSGALASTVAAVIVSLVRGVSPASHAVQTTTYCSSP